MHLYLLSFVCAHSLVATTTGFKTVKTTPATKVQRHTLKPSEEQKYYIMKYMGIENKICKSDHDCSLESCCVGRKAKGDLSVGYCKARSTINQYCAPFHFLQTQYCGCVLGLVCSYIHQKNTGVQYICRQQRSEAIEVREKKKLMKRFRKKMHHKMK